MRKTSSLGKCVPSNRRPHDVTVHCLLPKRASIGTPSSSLILRTQVGEFSSCASCASTSGVAALVDRREGSTLIESQCGRRSESKTPGARKDFVKHCMHAFQGSQVPMGCRICASDSKHELHAGRPDPLQYLPARVLSLTP
jgi:hypothetical protein